jgi:hypothetical protein
MDDDKGKGVIQKTIEAVEEFAHDVRDVAKHMMDPEPLKSGDEIVMMPTADYGMFSPPVAPQFVVIHHPKKSRAKTATKEPPKKSSKKNAAKKWKSPAKVVAKKGNTIGKKAVKKAKKLKR